MNRSPNRNRLTVLLALILPISTPGQAMGQALGQMVLPQNVEIGRLVEGELGVEDGVESYRLQRADRFIFEAYTGQSLEIIMRSETFDTYLLLEGPSGSLIAEDDDGGGDLDSRLELAIPLDGVYTILASSYGPEEGSYELLVRESHRLPLIWEPMEIGSRVEGELTDTDSLRTDWRRADGYRFDGVAGEHIRLTLTSDEIDTILYLFHPTGEVIGENDDIEYGVDTNSEISAYLRYSGEYRVVVTSYEQTTHGGYQLELNEVPASPIENRPIRMGEPVSSQLDDGDGVWTPRNTYADGYTFEGRSGQQVQIGLNSNDFDTYVILLDPDGTIMGENDDAGGTLNSQLTTYLSTDGTHRVIATAFMLATGDYNLSLRSLETSPLEQVNLSPGETLLGELSSDDPVGTHQHSHRDLYRMDLEAGQQVVIGMRSEFLNSNLTIITPLGETLTDDDSGGGVDAMLTLTAHHDGQFIIVASAQVGQVGAYSLSLGDWNRPDGSAAIELSYGDTHTENLGPGDRVRQENGSFYDIYSFTGSRGDLVDISINSGELDPYAVLVCPDGELLTADDDGGGDLNSWIRTILPEDGLYRLHATSYRPTTGGYTVALSQSALTPVETNSIAIDQTVEGELTNRDPRSFGHGTLVDAYRLPGEQGQHVEISMASSYVDSYLILIDPNGEVVSNDDDSGGGLNARIETTFTMSGVYRVLVTTAHYAEGSYSLTVGPAVRTVSSPFVPR